MKILIITPRIPYPPYRGDKLKIFNICKRLIKYNDVRVMTFINNSSDINYVNELKNLGIIVEYIKLPFIKSLMNLFLALFTLTPLQVLFYQSYKMKKKIKELTTKENYDVIYFHLFTSAQYFYSTDASNALKVIDYTDASSLYLRRYVEFIKNPFRKLFFKHELLRLLKYEKIANLFDTLFICSKPDKDYLFNRIGHGNIRLLYNGIDIETFAYEKITPQKGRIIFTGNLPYFPNQDAILFFAKEIFPLILEKHPYAKFYIVGQLPSREIRNLGSENIVVTGFVPDIRKEYLLSEVNIAPIRFGSGTLNKIIEALALGVPTVATNLSIKGFPEPLKKYVQTADNPQEFADKIIDLFENVAVRENLMKEGMNTITNMLAWDKIVSDFEVYLKQRVQAR